MFCKNSENKIHNIMSSENKVSFSEISSVKVDISTFC